MALSQRASVVLAISIVLALVVIGFGGMILQRSGESGATEPAEFCPALLSDSPSPVGYWDMSTLRNGNIANLADPTGATDGIIHNAILDNHGRYGACYAFSSVRYGVNSNVECKDPNSRLDFNNGTAMAWIKSSDPAYFECVLHRANNTGMTNETTTFPGWSFYANNGGATYPDYLMFYASTPDNGGFVYYPPLGHPLFGGDWHHVAVTFQGTSVKMYYDGVSDGRNYTTVCPVDGSPTEHFLIGNEDTLWLDSRQGYFNGSIDEVKLFDVVLTEDQIRDQAFEVADWTIAVYEAADNNLEYFSTCIFQTMANIGSSSSLQIVELMDRTPSVNVTMGQGYSDNFGNWTDTRLFNIHQYDTPVPENNYAGWDPHERNMGDNATLVEFGNFVLDNFPSTHYAFILADHGSGYFGCCWDETSGNDFLTNQEVRDAFAQIYAHKGSRIDLVVFDACEMGTIEGFYSLGGYADVVVGSEFIMYNGYPYSNWSNYYGDPPWVLNDLVANTEMTPQQLGDVFAHDYMESHNGPSSFANCSIGAWNVDALYSPSFLAKLDDFSIELIESIHVVGAQVEDIRANKTIRSSEWLTTTVDLTRIADQIADPGNAVNDPGLVNAALALSAYLKETSTRYAYYNYTVNPPVQYFGGMTVYYPCKGWSQGYWTTYDLQQIAVDSYWENYLRAYFHTYGSDAIAPSTVVPQDGESGTVGENGWWKSTVSVTLSASDGGGCGVLFTRYRVDGGPLQLYSGPITVSGEGNHSLEYYSVDRNGNVEMTNTRAYHIDVTTPVTSASVDGSQVTLSVGTDTSGVAATYYRIDSGSTLVYTAPFDVEPGLHTVYFNSVDVAGNAEQEKSIQVDVEVLPVLLTVNAGYYGKNGALSPLTVSVEVDASPPMPTPATFDVSPPGSSHFVLVADSTVVGRKTYYFQYWEGGGPSSNPGWMIATEDMTITAIYSTTVPVTYTLAISVNNGAWGYTDPSGTQTVSGGTQVTVTAHPYSGYVFSHWLLDGHRKSGNPYTVAVNSNSELQAVFQPEVVKYYTVTVIAYYGTGGGWVETTAVTVNIDGMTVGKTPWTSEVAAGIHSVQLSSTIRIAGKIFALTLPIINGPSTNGGDIDIQSNLVISAYYSR